VRRGATLELIASLSIACAALVFAPVSRAQPPPGNHPLVQLALDPCLGVPSEGVREIVRVELGALLVPEGGNPGSDVTQVHVTCGPTTTMLRVDDPVTGKSLTREIDLSKEASAARPRLLALAIVELVSASWTELEANPQPKVKPVGAVASPTAKAAAKKIVEDKLPPPPAPPPSLRIEALAGRRWFFPRTGPSNMFGLRLGDDRIGSIGTLGWLADMVVEHAGVNDSLGTVNVDLVSASVAIVAQHHTDALSLRAGLGLRYGSARISGTPIDAAHVESSSLAGVWGGPLVVAGVGFTPLRPLVLEVLVEGGWTATAVRAHVGDPGNVGPSGGWLGASLAIGLEP
jgi:hypothetical protein